MHGYRHTHMHARTHTHTCMCACMHTCSHTHAQAFIHTHTYTHTHIHNWPTIATCSFTALGDPWNSRKRDGATFMSNLLYLLKASMATSSRNSVWHNQETKGNVLQLALYAESINGHLVQEFCLARSRNKAKQPWALTCSTCWKHRRPFYPGIVLGRTEKRRETNNALSCLLMRQAYTHLTHMVVDCTECYC